jgi:hypothetical protein
LRAAARNAQYALSLDRCMFHRLARPGPPKRGLDHAIRKRTSLSVDHRATTR